MMKFLIFFLLTIFIGISIFNLVKSIKYNISLKKIRKDSNKAFRELSDIIPSSVFNGRLNKVIFIKSFLPEHGTVLISYFVGMRDISIFKDSVCIYTSNNVDDEVLNSLVYSIDIYYGPIIEDTVEVMGFLFHRPHIINVLTQLQKEQTREKGKEINDIDNIIENNNNLFDINEILDKINKVGLSNLTIEEKEFLDNYKG